MVVCPQMALIDLPFQAFHPLLSRFDFPIFRILSLRNFKPARG
jgi:hypothetical protein